MVANMSRHLDDIKSRTYLCPSKEADFEPRYKHYPARYIACFVSGGAKYVGEVDACIRLTVSSPPEVLWKFTAAGDGELVDLALRKQSCTPSPNRPPCLVFLIGDLTNTDFVYDLKGGMQQSCAYFDLSSISPADLRDVATKLRSNPWSSLPKYKGR